MGWPFCLGGLPLPYPLRVREIKLEERIVKEVGVAWRRDAASPLVDAAVQFAREWVK